MLKFKVLSIILTFSFLSNTVFGQKRIGFELSPRWFNINATIHYQQVFKKNFLFSSGIFFGSFGRGEMVNSSDYLKNGYTTNSPYREINKDISDTSGTYSLASYLTTGKGLGLQLGLVFFMNFQLYMV